MSVWRLLLAAVVLVLAGCATQEAERARDISDISTAGKGGACVRACLDSHAQCAAGASRGSRPSVAREGLLACRSNYEVCVRTC